MSSAPLLLQLLSIFDLRVVDFGDKKDKRFIFILLWSIIIQRSIWVNHTGPYRIHTKVRYKKDKDVFVGNIGTGLQFFSVRLQIEKV